MIVEIRKAGFVNKGAELMLLAILDRIRRAYPDVIFTMAPTPEGGDQPFRKIVQNNVYPKAWLWSYGFQVGDFASLLPGKFRERFGIVLDRDVDVVIDAAGFAYSDFWGEDATAELARCTRRWKKNGKLVIMLPQAFGPFRNRRMKRYLSQSIDNVDLVFAREQESYQYIVDECGPSSKVHIAPDFTNTIAGTESFLMDSSRHQFCLVPNSRMIDKADGYEGSLYLPFLIKCAEYLKEKQAKPFLLVHEGAKDVALAKAVSESVGDIDILTTDDALEVKGIIGASVASIGSRYHGLVSALSQGVPCLATAWSHKYHALFRDYGFSEGILPLDIDEEALCKKLDLLLDKSERRKLSNTLKIRSQEIQLQTEAMWRLVFARIDDKLGTKAARELA